ncbi:AcrA Membrane-fusion protein [Burkholderiaceae bacterium]
MKWRSKLWWAVALLAVAAALGYYLRQPAPASNTKPTPAAPAAAPAPAGTAPAAVMDIQASDLLLVEPQMLVNSLPISGNLKAINTVAVKARVPGELIEIKGREGDSVKAGEVVARLDPTEFQRRLRQAEQQADAAKTQIDIAKRQYDNNKALVEQGFISKTALDTSQASLAGAQATYNAALAGADVARKTLEDTVMRSPITGQIASRLAQPGEHVGMDMRLMDIVDLGSLELEATLSPADSVDVRIGQEAALSLEGRAQTINAKVLRINPSVQANSRSVLVYLRLQSTTGLKQGMYAQGDLQLSLSKTVALPLSAVRTDKPQPYVQMLVNNKVAHQTVSLGERGRLANQNNGEQWVAIRDLPPNSQVLPASVGALREGSPVRLISAAAPASTAKP